MLKTNSRLLVNLEYQGFLKFLNRGSSQLMDWFGEYCNHDPIQIIKLSASEWDAMADEERRHFIKAQFLNSRAHEHNGPTGKHPFMSYLLQKRYSDISTLNKPLEKRPFTPKSTRLLSQEYNELSEREREKYGSETLPEIGMKHVLERRDKLHKMFEPKELHILEYMIKTMPQRPVNPRAWYFSLKNHSIKNPYSMISWRELEPERKRFYEDCSQLDRKRYRFEKNAWLTQLLLVDFDNEDTSLLDFESQRAKSNIEALNAIIELNKDNLPTSARAKRPISAFALFVRDYNKENGATSFTGQNVNPIAEAWHNLSEEERQIYKEASRALRNSYNDSLKNKEDGDHHFDLYSVSGALFKHSKFSDDPTRPSHLSGGKFPTLVDFYGKSHKIAKGSRQQAWDRLEPSEKEMESKKYDAHISQLIEKAQEMEKKLAHIQQMIEKAKELKKIKSELRLINRNTKFNLYPQLQMEEQTK